MKGSQLRSSVVRALAPAAPATPLGPWLRLHLTYWWRHRRRLSLDRPMRFTELIQRRKLRDRDQRLPHLIDKVAVKRFVAEVLGDDWVTPTLWSGDALPDAPSWPYPFVVKSRHGCNQRHFVRDAHADWPAIRAAAAGWMRSDYGRWLDEWGYRGVTRGVLVEPFVGDGATLPIDYKCYVFHGRVAAVQVHLDREHGHRWMLFDPTWRRLSSPTAEPDPAPPAALDRMIAGAETLARGFDFVRVDFYDTGTTPRFSEMTFYPGSGLDPFDPPVLDDALGQLWRASAPGEA
ncbi:ATP-grasp fold amidoligase family protein [Sphingomonas sp. RT2P30]|uniref:ATP-grasp fold amidoligase family protein n=1 Tax=Parasphingomonas halimpatiens TaxID=3096162 RepID=UPI002FCB3F77